MDNTHVGKGMDHKWIMWWISDWTYPHSQHPDQQVTRCQTPLKPCSATLPVINSFCPRVPSILTVAYQHRLIMPVFVLYICGITVLLFSTQLYVFEVHLGCRHCEPFSRCCIAFHGVHKPPLMHSLYCCGHLGIFPFGVYMNRTAVSISGGHSTQFSWLHAEQRNSASFHIFSLSQ